MLPARMDGPPTSPGYYWIWTDSPSSMVVCVFFSEHDGRLMLVNPVFRKPYDLRDEDSIQIIYHARLTLSDYRPETLAALGLERHAPMSTSQKVAQLKEKIAGVERICSSPDPEDSPYDTWDLRYHMAFELYRTDVLPAIEDLGVHFTYYDPDTSYEEDVKALVGALSDLKRSLPEI